MPFVASSRQKSSQGIESMKSNSCLTCHLIQSLAIGKIRTECLSTELVQRCFCIRCEVVFVCLFCLIS